MKMISIENLILFNKKIIKETGVSTGIRDISLIDSALNRALTTYNEQDLYPSIIEKISVITYSLINNHAFVDGNKRIGVATMILLLKINNINIQYTQKELIDLGLKIAEGLIKENDIVNFIKEHIK